jgi:hypothetical protein
MKWSLVKLAMVFVAGLATFGTGSQVCVQAFSPAGIKVDAEGVLRNRSVVDPSGQLDRQRANQAMASLNRDLATPSQLRKVSLARLQSEMQRLLDDGQSIPEDMLYLAGLTSVTHVFCYPESGDIVLAGPAEGYFHDATGHVRGVHSGRATVQLQDLLAALRAFPHRGTGESVIGCSIDPTQEGLARMQQFVSSVNMTSPNQAPAIAEGVRQSLGMQTVKVMGVPANTHFAHVLVEADYRMKLFGLGLERVPGLVAYVDKVRGGSKNALVRWFFAPKYDAIQIASNDLAASLVGGSVELMTENEIVDQFGNRQVARKNANQASLAFCNSFTKNYEKISLADPVFAELKNCMDLAVLAAFIQSKDYYGLSGLTLDLLGSEDKLSITTLQTVKQVESVVTALFRNNQLITPVSGGVLVRPLEEVRESAVTVDESGKTDELRDQVKLSNLQPNQWWWD